MKKMILAMSVAAMAAMANGRDSGISYCVNLGESGSTSNISLVDANKYCITQFPTWSYGKVRVNVAPVNGAFTGAVVINGEVHYLNNVWFQSFEVAQNSAEPVSVIIDNDNTTPAQLGVQWWVEQ